MNPYLTTLLNAIAIDQKHLRNEFLKKSEIEFIDCLLASEDDFVSDFYISDCGEHLECLLFFLTTHKQDIVDLMQNCGKKEKLYELYTSSTISGSYDCFRFDLSKFPKAYSPNNNVLTVYRIGRDGECEGNLGCSWATSLDGLRVYCASSALSHSILKSKQLFVATVDDSQVLFEGNKSECEVVLKPDFKHLTLATLEVELRSLISE